MRPALGRTENDHVPAAAADPADPAAVTPHQVEKVLRSCWLRRLVLLPRFQRYVQEDLGAAPPAVSGRGRERVCVQAGCMWQGGWVGGCGRVAAGVWVVMGEVEGGEQG